MSPVSFARHARTCSGHPRRADSVGVCDLRADVDGRDKPTAVRFAAFCNGNESSAVQPQAKVVMPRLVRGIHVGPSACCPTWMAGTEAGHDDQNESFLRAMQLKFANRTAVDLFRASTSCRRLECVALRADVDGRDKHG